MYFENQINEFIGLAVYLAKKLYGDSGIPLGPIEKMLSISKNLFAFDFPNYNSIITKRGSMGVVTPEEIVAYQKPLYVRDIKSRYFQIEKYDNKTLFKPKNDFIQKLDTIISKSYYGNYESVLRSLLEIWKVGGYAGLMLIDMTRTSDHGLKFFVADLEIAATELQRFIDNKFASMPSKRDYKFLFNDALDSFDYKIRAIQRKDNFIKQAKLRCNSPYSLNLISNLYLIDDNFPLLMLLKKMRNIISDVGLGVLNDSPDLLQKIGSANSILAPYGKKQYEDVDTELKKFFTIMHSWFLALSGNSKSDLYSQKVLSVAGGERSAIAACDIIQFSPTLDAFADKYGTLDKDEVNKWFCGIRSTTKNWLLAFDGLLSNTATEEGDSFFACFTGTKQAIVASAFAVCHLDLYNLPPKSHKTNPDQLIKIGISKEAVSARVLDDVDISTGANELFNKIKDLKLKGKLTEISGSFIFVLPDIITEHEELKQFIKKDLGSIIVIDHGKIVRDFVSNKMTL